MKNLPKLFISISDLKISIIAGCSDEQNNFELLEKISLSINGKNENKISDLDKIANLIKKNILFIEQKVNYTFKDVIIILDNFTNFFLNLSGFKKLNGTQVSKENIIYILNSLKSYIDKFEKNKKILHIFNSEYCLDKKKIDNLPIGLFGDFYSHELSFCLIDKNDYKNLENIFSKCNLKINKILSDSFINGILINNKSPLINTFFYIQINEDNSKILYYQNDTVKCEQKFKFGSNIIHSDISKITALNSDILKKIIEDNVLTHDISATELIEKKFFKDSVYRKIKKKLILQIAEARINEFKNIIYFKNINFGTSLNKVKTIFLEITDKHHLKCFEKVYLSIFNNMRKFEVKIFEKPDTKSIMNAANIIAEYGWKNEAIPVSSPKKSFLSRIFKEIFD